MSVSGIVDTPTTVRSFCTQAARKIRILDSVTSLPSEDFDAIRLALLAMLRTWEVDGVRLWTTEEVVVTAVIGQQDYTLTPRAVRVVDARYLLGTAYTPVRVVTREEWERLPQPQSPGTPYWIYLDRRRDASVVKFYPVPNVAMDMLVTINRPLYDVLNANEDVDVPPEWSEAIIYNLAARIADDFGKADPVTARVIERSEILYTKLAGQDREQSTWFRMRRY